MIFKHSIKSLLRTPAKTLLFFLLIAIMTAVSVLGLSMRQSSVDMLQEADEQFVTTAQLEYIGVNYPEYSTYDNKLASVLGVFQFDSMQNIPYVKSFERNLSLRGYIDGFQFKSTQSLYKDNVVIVFKVAGIENIEIQKTVYDYETGIPEIQTITERHITCYLLSAPYSREYEGRDTIFTIVDDDSAISPYGYAYDGGIKTTYEVGNFYLGHGEFYKNSLNGNQLMFVPGTFDPQALTDEELISTYVVNEFGNISYFATLRNSGINYLLFDRYGIVCDVTQAMEETNRDLFRSVNPELWDFSNYSGYGYPISPEDLFSQLAESLRVINNSIAITVTDNLGTLPEFQKGETYIEEGRFFNADDGSNAVVLSQTIANNLGIGVGDTIDLKLHCPSARGDIDNSFWVLKGFLNEENSQYTVVGICKSNDGSVFNAYIPAIGNAELVTTYPPSYNLGRFVIENGYGQDFSEIVNSFLIPGMTVSVYDQGYMLAKETFSSLEETSIILLIGCALVGVIVLLLFAYIFVLRQQTVIKIMLSLGTGERRVYTHLTLGVLPLVILAAIFGACAGFLLSGVVLNAAYGYAAAHGVSDTLYGIMYTKNATDSIANFSGNVILSSIGACTIILASVLFCSILARRALVSLRTDESRTPAARRRRTIHVFKHALRSVRRNAARSFIVPAVTLVIALLLIAYGFILASYQSEIDALYETIPISGYFTSTNGKMRDSLTLGGDSRVEAVAGSELVEVFNYSYNLRAKFVCKTADADGNLIDEHKNTYLDIPLHGNQDGLEMFNSTVVRTWDNAVCSTDIATAPEFMYNILNIKYLDGYDENVFTTDESVCAIPADFASENSILLGDTIRICTFYRYGASTYEVAYGHHDLKVIAYFGGQSARANFYCPALRMALAIPVAYDAERIENEFKLTPKPFYNAKTGETFMMYEYVYVGDGNPLLEGDVEERVPFPEVMHSARFTLKTGVGVLEDFKKLLREQEIGSVSWLSPTRITVALDEAALSQSIEGAAKVSGYMESLYPVLYTLVTAIGFVVSYLLTKNRREELAIMRSTGAGALKTYFAFFTEQAILCALGVAAGFGIGCAVFGMLDNNQVISLLIYVACYMAGILISCATMSKVNVLKLLSAKE